MVLRAYSVAEDEKLGAGVHNQKMLDCEKLLAQEFVEASRSEPEGADCPVCGSGSSEFFAEFWGAGYMRCQNCWSIFVPVGESIIDEYRRYAPLREFRASERYQADAEEKRKYIWDEKCFWIKFRLARYLGKAIEPKIADVGNRYKNLSDRFRSIGGEYRLVPCADEMEDPADIVFYFDQLTFEPNPPRALEAMRRRLNPNGLLFLSTRVGSGFDILTLKGGIGNIYPYEHSFLPSKQGLEMLLQKTGYELLEISTPGSLDMKYVEENRSKLDKKDLFARYLLEKTDESVLAEFQRFLQKSGMSSHAQLVARPKKDGE